MLCYARSSPVCPPCLRVGGTRQWKRRSPSQLLVAAVTGYLQCARTQWTSTSLVRNGVTRGSNTLSVSYSGNNNYDTTAGRTPSTWRHDSSPWWPGSLPQGAGWNIIVVVAAVMFAVARVSTLTVVKFRSVWLDRSLPMVHVSASWTTSPSAPEAADWVQSSASLLPASADGARVTGWPWNRERVEHPVLAILCCARERVGATLNGVSHSWPLAPATAPRVSALSPTSAYC